MKNCILLFVTIVYACSTPALKSSHEIKSSHKINVIKHELNLNGNAKIIGNVTDKVTKEKIEFAQIIINNQTILTDSIGGFSYIAKSGTYNIVIKSAGIQYEIKNINLKENSINQVDIFLGVKSLY